MIASIITGHLPSLLTTICFSAPPPGACRREHGCTRNPVYGNIGDPRATYCLSHKAPLMVDVKNRCCEHPGCKHQPSFGLVGDRRANFCFAHKLPNHVNIRRARARAS